MLGSEARVGRLSRELALPLLRYFARRVDPPGDAADLLGDTFVVLCRRAADLPADDDEARLWAFGVARKVLADHRRRGRRASNLIHALRDELDATPGPTDTDYATTSRVRSALAGLDDLDREIIRLVHWDGFTQLDVASLLGLPPGTVRSRHTRARASLRRHLEGTAPLPSRR